MQISKDFGSLQNTFQLNDMEMREISARLPGVLADRIATKFFEANGDKFLKDKEFMQEVRRLSINRATALISALIEQKIEEAMGIKPDKE